jgi:hypothetical protein
MVVVESYGGSFSKGEKNGKHIIIAKGTRFVGKISLPFISFPQLLTKMKIAMESKQKATGNATGQPILPTNRANDY